METRFSERQLIRWALPGWIVFFLALLTSVPHLFLDEEFRKQAVNLLVNNGVLSPANVLGAVAAGITIGFALGFMLFQVYFFVNWRRPRLVGGPIVFDDVLKALRPFKDKLEKELGKPFPAAGASKLKDKQDTEFYVQALWWRGVGFNREQRTVWDDRATYVVAVYHALGAIIIGMYVIMLLYVLVVAVVVLSYSGIKPPVQAFFAVPINIVILILLWRAVRSAREDSRRAHLELTTRGLFYFCQQDFGQ